MKVKVKHANKGLFIIFIILGLKGFGQDRSSYSYPFIRSFNKYFTISPAFRDSCISTSALLRIYFDKNLKPLIEFSDTALPELKKQLIKASPKLDVKSLQDYLKLEAKRDVSMIFPVFIINKKWVCKNACSFEWYGQGYTNFDNRLLEKECILREPIYLYIH